MRFYPSRARRSSCWSTCPPPVSAGMRVPCANRTDSSTQHQRYHLLSVADLNSSRNRNFVHMKGERQRRRRPRVLKRNSAKLNTLALPMINRDLEGRGGSSRARGRSFKRAPRSLPRIGSAVCTRSQCEFFKNVRGPWLSVLRCYLGYA